MKRSCSPSCLAGLYAALAAAWIILSDAFFSTQSLGLSEFTYFSLVKGLGFVFVTALGLFALLKWNDRQREEDRRESEERFHLMAENAPDIIYRYRLESPRGFEYVSPSVLKITGYSPEEHYADPDLGFKIVHPEDRQRFLRIQSDGSAPVVPFRWIRKDGSVIWTEQRNVLIHNEQNVVVAIEGIARDITERVKSEKTMRLQSAALESSANAIVITDSEGNIESTNRAFTELTGYEQREVIGQKPSLLKSGKQDPAFYTDMWKTILSGGVWRGQLINRRKDGTEYVEEQTITPVQDEPGAISHFVAIKQDITERKHAAELLSRSEKKYRDIIEQASDGIFIAGPDGRILLVNNKASEMTGYTRDELHRMNIADTYAVEDRPLGEGRIEELRKNRTLRFERKLRRKDGSAIPVEVSIQVLEDGTSQGIVRDISQRLDAEERIREQAALLDVTSDAIIARDLDNVITYWNKGAETMYGWGRDQVRGRKGNEIFYRKNSDGFSGLREKVLANGEWEGELEHLTKDGTWLTVQSRWTLMRNETGTPVGILSVNTDITEKKNFESQVLRAQRLESLGTLAGGIAHDLNNVLAPIILSFDAIKRSITDQRALQVLTTAETSANRGKHIVAQVLAFARGIDKQRGPVQIRHLVREIEEIVKETFPKSIEVRTDVAKDLWPVSGDATQIHQVLMNLCLNARDAMMNGGKLSIKAGNLLLDREFAAMRLGSHAGPYVVIEVSDTGIGISQEHREKIFDPFFTTKEIGKGTGLGLSTTHTIVKSHGGFIDVNSAVNVGTTFKVFFPAQESAVQEHAVPANEDSLNGNGELILVVDDESSIRDITSEMLQTMNYQVITAKDGIEAVAQAAKHRNSLNLILMDLMMPEMDGPSAIRAIRRIVPTARIIACSGMIGGKNDPNLVGLDVEEFLDKPFTAQRLLSAIRTVLKKSEEGGDR